MSPTLIRWLPRIAAILFTLFITLFAFDSGDGPAEEHRMDLLMHLLPTLFCAGIIVLAWQREWIGGVVFLALTVFYAWWAFQHPLWILTIGGPLLVLAGLYVWAWVERKRGPRPTV